MLLEKDLREGAAVSGARSGGLVAFAQLFQLAPLLFALELLALELFGCTRHVARELLAARRRQSARALRAALTRPSSDDVYPKL